MSDCLLRVAEAAALNVADISFVDDWLQVVVRRSKTDQEGDGAVLYAGPPTARLARLWLATAGIDDGALFRRVNKVGAIDDGRLSARRMRDIVKRRAEDVGIEGRVSGHSFRVGAAQSLRGRGHRHARTDGRGALEPHRDDGPLHSYAERVDGTGGEAPLRSRAA